MRTQAAPVILLDPNTLSDDGTVALKDAVFSDNGELLAYSLSSGGSDWSTIKVCRALPARSAGSTCNPSDPISLSLLELDSVVECMVAPWSLLLPLIYDAARHMGLLFDHLEYCTQCSQLSFSLHCRAAFQLPVCCADVALLCNLALLLLLLLV